MVKKTCMTCEYFILTIKPEERPAGNPKWICMHGYSVPNTKLNHCEAFELDNRLSMMMLREKHDVEGEAPFDIFCEIKEEN